MIGPIGQPQLMDGWWMGRELMSERKMRKMRKQMGKQMLTMNEVRREMRQKLGG